MEYKSEKEFLAAYNPDEFKRVSITADVLLLSVSSYESDNYRKTDEKHMSVLLIKRDTYPFKNKWCFPGGFVQYDENLDDAPARILKSETNLTDIYLEQIYTYGDTKRDPRMRVLSTAYMALVDKNKLVGKISDNASWFDIRILEENNIIDIFLRNGEKDITVKIKKVLREATTDRYDVEIVENKDLAFDHAKVLLSGIERLRNKVNYTDIVFNMMPEYFTLGELQTVYEVILNKKLLDPAFRRIIEPKVVKTDKMRTGEGHRPSVLFKYKNNK